MRELLLNVRDALLDLTMLCLVIWGLLTVAIG